jgi:NADPH-dependent curcumin reductase CurA
MLIAIRTREEGHLVSDFSARLVATGERLGKRVATGDLKHRETIVEGLEHALGTFLGLFSGDNIGKTGHSGVPREW